MRRLLGIALIACLIAPFLGALTWLQCQKSLTRHAVKQQIMGGIERSELVLLKFTAAQAAQLDWEHAKEFEYQGQMFDIVEQQAHGDTTWYWCWPDDDETQLNRQLERLVAQAMGHDPQNKSRQQQLSDFFQTLYHEQPIAEDLSLQAARKAEHPSRDMRCSSTAPDPQAPPPKHS